MPSANPQRDLVLFLGAGFSAVLDNFPTMNCFCETSKKRIEECRQHVGNREEAGIYLEAGEVFSDFQQSCESAKRFLNIKTNNLETLFCMAEAIRESGIHQVSLQRTSLSPDKLVRQLQLWLWKVYQRNPFVKKHESAYVKLMEALDEKGLGGHTTVLTTNYDLVFESFAWRHECSGPSQERLSCQYGLPNWAPVRVGKQHDSYLADQSDTSAPLVCKLHGSINYFEEPGAAEIAPLQICVDLMHQGDRLSYLKPVVHRSKDPRPYVLCDDAVAMLRTNYGRRFVPAIIAPTHAKFQQRHWLRAIWSNAFEALKSAKTIVFIGYSIPESDGHMRSMIQAAMAGREPDENPKVYVFDLCEETLMRYRTFFGPLGLQTGQHLCQMSFKQAMEKELPKLLNCHAKGAV